MGMRDTNARQTWVCVRARALRCTPGSWGPGAGLTWKAPRCGTTRKCDRRTCFSEVCQHVRHIFNRLARATKEVHWLAARLETGINESSGRCPRSTASMDDGRFAVWGMSAGLKEEVRGENR